MPSQIALEVQKAIFNRTSISSQELTGFSFNLFLKALTDEEAAEILFAETNRITQIFQHFLDPIYICQFISQYPQLKNKVFARFAPLSDYVRRISFQYRNVELPEDTLKSISNLLFDMAFQDEAAAEELFKNANPFTVHLQRHIEPGFIYQFIQRYPGLKVSVFEKLAPASDYVERIIRESEVKSVNDLRRLSLLLLDIALQDPLAAVQLVRLLDSIQNPLTQYLPTCMSEEFKQAFSKKYPALQFVASQRKLKPRSGAVATSEDKEIKKDNQCIEKTQNLNESPVHNNSALGQKLLPSSGTPVRIKGNSDNDMAWPSSSQQKRRIRRSPRPSFKPYLYHWDEEKPNPTVHAIAKGFLLTVSVPLGGIACNELIKAVQDYQDGGSFARLATIIGSTAIASAATSYFAIGFLLTAGLTGTVATFGIPLAIFAGVSLVVTVVSFIAKKVHDMNNGRFNFSAIDNGQIQQKVEVLKFVEQQGGYTAFFSKNNDQIRALKREIFSSQKPGNAEPPASNPRK